MTVKGRAWPWVVGAGTLLLVGGAMWALLGTSRVNDAESSVQSRERRTRHGDNSSRPQSPQGVLLFPQQAEEAPSSAPVSDASLGSVDNFRQRATAAYDRRLAEYQRDLARFRAETAAFRNAWPEFGDYARRYQEVIAPAVIEGVKSRLSLRRDGILVDDEGVVDPDIGVTVACWFGDIAARLRMLLDTGRVELPEDQQESLGQLERMLAFYSVDGVDAAPACPHGEGTDAYRVYMAQLATMTRLCVDSMSEALRALPSELAASKIELKERRAELQASALSFPERALPDVIEPYTQAIMDIDKTVQSTIDEWKVENH